MSSTSVHLSYVLVSSAFGTLGIVWWENEAGPRVRRIFLPTNRVGDRVSVRDAVQAAFPGAVLCSCPTVVRLGEQMQSFLEGDTVCFELSFLALERCSNFQRSVLLAEHEIPRGWVSTYGRIAGRVGVSGGARAVGNALARNPFPIVIPCHRAVRSDGRLGGFRGGLEMKRALLELDGVEITPAGRVCTDQVYF
jgi:methylated-DNA-[protein]-cysteine S-methyltransferase